MWGELDTVDVMLVNVDAKLSDLHNGEVGGTPEEPRGRNIMEDMQCKQTYTCQLYKKRMLLW